MRYIIPSIGRCASSMMAHQIHKAAGSPDWQYRQDWINAPDQVIKTHAHFEHEPAFDYRAVYCTGRIGDVIASMFRGMDGHLMQHLVHLDMSGNDLRTAWGMGPSQYLDRWIYWVDGDRFRFKRNLESWRQAEHVLFVHYDQWEADPVMTFNRVSAFTGLPIVPTPIKPRRGHMNLLPKSLQDAIRQEYGDLA